MGEGIGVDFNQTNDKFYEDFINLNGKLLKLDQTRLTLGADGKGTIADTHHFQTISSKSRVFKERSCKLDF